MPCFVQEYDGRAGLPSRGAFKAGVDSKKRLELAMGNRTEAHLWIGGCGIFGDSTVRLRVKRKLDTVCGLHGGSGSSPRPFSELHLGGNKNQVFRRFAQHVINRGDSKDAD